MQNAKVFMWDTGNSLGELTGHGKRVISAAYRPARPFKLITASEDTRTVFYNGPPFVLDHSNTEHSNWVNCVRYSPDGNTIITVGSDKKVTLHVHTLVIQSWHVNAKVDALTPSRLRGRGFMMPSLPLVLLQIVFYDGKTGQFAGTELADAHAGRQMDYRTSRKRVVYS